MAKQARICSYFGKKSPKFTKAKTRAAKEAPNEERTEVEVEPVTKTLESVRGASGPLLRDSEDPMAQKTSEAMGGATEERGRCTKDIMRIQKRTKLVMERWPLGQAERKEGQAPKTRTKRKTEGSQRK